MRRLIWIRAGAVLVAVAAVALVAAPAQAAARCGGKRVTIHDTSGADVIHGTARPDVIDAGRGNDYIYGLGGNDRICGGRGLDHLFGGSGNDRLYGGLDSRADSSHKYGDILNGGAGNDLLSPGLDRRPIHGAGVPDVISWRSSPRPISLNMAKGVATGLGHDRIIGHSYTARLSQQSDRVIGTRGNDFIETFAGADTIRGGAGNDLLFTDDPNRATPATGPSRDLVYGGAGDDWIIGREGFDRLYGGPGQDEVDDRGPTADYIVGGPGSDGISDVIAGGVREHVAADGRDSLTVSAYTNQHAPGTLDLQAHTTHIDGVAGNGYINGFRLLELNRMAGPGVAADNGRPWTVVGTAAPERVGVITSYAVRFLAAGGDDRFIDGPGDDTYDGGPGTDEIAGEGGGTGTDTCTSVEVGTDLCEVITP